MTTEPSNPAEPDPTGTGPVSPGAAPSGAARDDVRGTAAEPGADSGSEAAASAVDGTGEPTAPVDAEAGTAVTAAVEPAGAGDADDSTTAVGEDAEAGTVTTADDETGDADGPADDETRDGDADAEDDRSDAGSRTASVDEAASTASPGPADGLARSVLDTFRRPRLSGAAIIIALLVGLLGFALIAQVKSNNSASTLTNDRPDDLVRILSDLDSRKDRLDNEITSLQTQEQQLNSGAQGQQAALNAATQRADELGILAGTVPAVGPGLVVRMAPATKPISSIVVLETIEELRGAGAEAIEISGTNSSTVRVIVSTWFGDGDNGIVVSGTQMSGTLTITAIGDSQTMQTALSIPGGVADTVQGDGGTVLLQPEARVQVTALAPTGTLKYAHPVP
jgi:uncharacterized protein YlxW (UPF0749 family)